jgi:hypothetical protein
MMSLDSTRIRKGQQKNNEITTFKWRMSLKKVTKTNSPPKEKPSFKRYKRCHSTTLKHFKSISAVVFKEKGQTLTWEVGYRTVRPTHQGE